jgi:hypothetical protein
MITPRAWIWAALVLYWIGVAYDIAWHGFIQPGFEADTFAEMLQHLRTVHLPIYLGVAALVVTTAWALVDHVRRGRRGVAAPLAFVGGLLAAVGEGWHAYSHLQLTTHVGPLAFSLGVVGMLIVLGALIAGGRAERRERERRLLTHS